MTDKSSDPKQKNEAEPLADKELEDVAGGIIIQRGITVGRVIAVDGGITQPLQGFSGPEDE